VKNKPGFIIKLRVTPHLCPELHNLLSGLPVAARGETIRVHLESALRGGAMALAAAALALTQQVSAAEAHDANGAATPDLSHNDADELAGECSFFM
jgi:hypothetical protein